VSNVGMHRVRYLTPIIDPGQAAILGVGSVQHVFRPGAPAANRSLARRLASCWDVTTAPGMALLQLRSSTGSPTISRGRWSSFGP
jgi:hypothetical protein